MNTHKHARLTFARRLEMVQQMIVQDLSAVQAAAVQGVTPLTARTHFKWSENFRIKGDIRDTCQTSFSLGMLSRRLCKQSFGCGLRAAA